MKALGTYVGVVVTHSTTQVSKGGFAVQNNVIPNTGTIHSVGPEVKGDIKAGDTVLFNNAGKWPVITDEDEGVDVTVMDEDAVLYLL